MKKQLIAFAMLLFVALTALADPTTFEEFKKMAQSDRKALFVRPAGPLSSKFTMWDLRLQMGEEYWQQRQLARLADAQGFADLDGMFVYYKEFKQRYLTADWSRRKSSIPVTDLAVRSAQWDREYDSLSSRYVQTLSLVASLAPTVQAQESNQKAAKVTAKWVKQFPPGSNYSVTPVQMAAMDLEIKQMIDAIKDLRQLTPTETQAAIERLPDDHMR